MTLTCGSRLSAVQDFKTWPELSAKGERGAAPVLALLGHGESKAEWAAGERTG
jgi:predicted TPR repeat methyltransferase